MPEGTPRRKARDVLPYGLEWFGIYRDHWTTAEKIPLMMVKARFEAQYSGLTELGLEALIEYLSLPAQPKPHQ